MDSKNAPPRRRSERINSDNYAHVHLQFGKASAAAAGGSSFSSWPYVSLSKHEIQEDFYNLTGSMHLRRPKFQRSKQVQDAISMISPGEGLRGKAGKRYEVKEKRTKKAPNGLKAIDKAMERAIKRAMDNGINGMNPGMNEEDGDAELLEGLEEYMDYKVGV